jgi:hypothetical protein
MGLKDIIGEVNGSSLASFGFTAATGGEIGKHEILSWSLFVPSSSSSSSNPSGDLLQSGDLLLQPTQIQAIANQGTNVVLQANNDITLRPNSSITIQSPTAGSGGISMQAGRSITLHSPITYVGNYSGPINLIANDTSLLPSFRDIGAGNLTVDTGATLTSSQALVSLRLGPGNHVYSPGVLQVNAPISASTVLARGASGITLSGAAVLTASAPSGRAITLDAGSGAFLNNSTSGATALSKQPGATWAIYADNPTSTPSVNLGGLPYSFKQYNQTFNTNHESNPILGSGNGLFFANSPTISVNLTSQVRKTYDGTNAARLVDSNYNITGVLSGDLVNINKPTRGTYDNKNVGGGKLVRTSGLTITSATESDSGVPIYGYNFLSAEASGAIGTINRASVTPSFMINNKLYDGNVAAEIAGNNLQGGLASDDVFIVGASAFFDNASVGNDKLVTITGYTLSGQAADNYQLSSPTATSTASITTQQDNGALPSNEEPIKNKEANPAVVLQLSKLSSPTASKSVDVDISNIVLLPPGASVLESTPSGSTQSQPTPTAASATSSVPNQSQPTASATAVTTGSATQEYQESDNRSAEDAKTSLGLSNAPSSEPISPARLQLVMQSAASFIRKYPVRTLNQ